MRSKNQMLLVLGAIAACLLSATGALASEADLAIPALDKANFHIFGSTIDGWRLMLYGAGVICITLFFSLYLRTQIHRLPSHKSMLDVADVIYATCKTY